MSIGLSSIEKKILLKDNIKPFDYTLNGDNTSLKLYNQVDSRYIEPIFSTKGGVGNGEAQVILISAIGATGKTSLTKKISCDLHCPVIDLAAERVVAGNSFTGILFNSINVNDISRYLSNIQEGNTIVILDALDEAYQKTKVEGFFDFLADIKKVIGKSGKIVMLGRTNAIELASLYFEEEGIKTVTLQIEPFTIQKAREFIDCYALYNKQEALQKPYKDLRDYIIDSIGGFFKSQGDMSNEAYSNFIGYAPVLLSVSTFIKEHGNNYHKILEDLQSQGHKNVSLIVDISMRVLKREKDKILDNFISNLLKNRDDKFINRARNIIYSEEEQCCRLLYSIMRKPYPYNSPMDDDAFDREYTEKIGEWVKEHPFLDGNNKPANTVFESFILAYLLKNSNYHDVVLEYLGIIKSPSYIFFNLYNEINKDSDYVNLELVQYLFSSLRALDTTNRFYSLDISSSVDAIEPHSDEKLDCDVCFIGSSDDLKPYAYQSSFLSTGTFNINTDLGNVKIDLPISVKMSGNKLNISAPTYIHCSQLLVDLEELILSNNSNENIIFEVNGIKTISTTSIKCWHTNNVKIISQSALTYPFNGYQVEPIEKEIGMNADMFECYQKMRRALIMFRSHSKGQLAKHKTKIDDRIRNTPIGQKVIDSLLSHGIIYIEEPMYFIDNKALAMYLGVKFDSLRANIITDQIKKFLAETLAD